MPARRAASMPAAVSSMTSDFGRRDRIALAKQKTQSAQRRDESVGLGLAVLDILSRDDIDKQIAQTGAAQNHLGLGAQRARDDHQRKSRRALAHEIGRARIHHVAIANHVLVTRGFARDQRIDDAPRSRPCGFP